MSSRPYLHSPAKSSPRIYHHGPSASMNHGLSHPVASNNWLNTDPYASPPPQRARPTSTQSSRPSSAGSAAQFYAQETGFYVPSQPSTNIRPYASNPYKDVRRPPSPHRDSTIRHESERTYLPAIPPFIPQPTLIITPDKRRPPTVASLTDENLEAHTKKTQSSHKSLHYSPSVATSLSVYSQESAPRSYHYPPLKKDFQVEVPETHAYVQLGRDTHSTEYTTETSATNDYASDYYQSSMVSPTTSLTTPQQSTWNLPTADIPSTPESIKEPKAVRYAMHDMVYEVDPEFITYVPAGPKAASTTNVVYTGIRNKAVKRGGAKRKHSASVSVTVQPVVSSSSSVKSLPMASGRKEHSYIKDKHHNRSFKDGETQSLYSAKSSTTMSAGKRLLSFFRFRRFLPQGKKKLFKNNNLSKLDLDSYEVNRYFSKA